MTQISQLGELFLQQGRPDFYERTVIYYIVKYKDNFSDSHFVEDGILKNIVGQHAEEMVIRKIEKTVEDKNW
jgi:hypothetical protein